MGQARGWLRAAPAVRWGGRKHGSGWWVPMGQEVPKILVIDDDEECLDLICRMLRQGGYKTVALTSGSRVLETIAKHDPALVLTDILMPGITGGMVYEMIRAKVGPYLPVVVCSGTRLKFKERDPLRAFLLKPVGCDSLYKMVGDLIGLAAALLREEEATAEHQPPGTDDDDLD
jgi:CheY-like chemotaxis protein